MNKIERLYRLHQILAGRRTALPLASIMADLACSESTARRTLDDLRNRLQAPLVYDAHGHGWRLDTQHGERPVELPGLWFSDTELHARLTAHELLGAIPPGLLKDELAPLTARLHTILARRGPREISPERLTWYRNNWYLDAWCHQADAFRRFACECITAPQPLPTPAKDCSETELNAYFSSAYGIFAGTAPHTATLRFSPERARWVADEQWHPQQQGQHLPDGRYELRIPYGTDTELLMDILRHGPEVEVIAPPALRAAARAQLARTLARDDDPQ